MRWPWSGADVAPVVDLDAIELDALEVVELDADGRLSGPDPAPAAEPMREMAYATGRDRTGLAGIWEALATEG